MTYVFSQPTTVPRATLNAHCRRPSSAAESAESSASDLMCRVATMTSQPGSPVSKACATRQCSVRRTFSWGGSDWSEFIVQEKHEPSTSRGYRSRPCGQPVDGYQNSPSWSDGC